MLVPVMVLAVLGVLRPRSLAVLLTLVVIAVVGPRLRSVTGTYDLFSFDVLANAEGNADHWRTPQQTFSAVIARGLAIGVWLAAFVAMLRFRRLIGRVLVPAALGFLPFITLIAGNYGGEAIYRVFAFSLPFAALLIAGFWAGTGRRGALAVVASGITLAVVLLACLQGLQGQLVVHRVRSDDIRAAEYFYGHAESSSTLVLVAPNFPTKLAGNYGSFNRNRTAVDITLVGDPQFINRLDGSRLPEVETYIRSLGTRTNYLVISDQMKTYTDFFGVMPQGAMASLDSALRASPDWQVFYQAPGVTIFRLIPAS
jgi:hypothetical protein